MYCLIFHINREYLLQEYCEQLIEMAVCFGVERLAFIDQTDGCLMAGVTNIRPAQLETHVFFDLADALEVLGGSPVFFEEGQATPLTAFQPPARPVYIFGPDLGGLVVPDGAEGVSIETACPGHLWSQQAAAIALNDFRLKLLPD
ncbi:MAG: hypothetical protein V7731_01865 [Amphritea sp.]